MEEMPPIGQELRLHMEPFPMRRIDRCECDRFAAASRNSHQTTCVGGKNDHSIPAPGAADGGRRNVADFLRRSAGDCELLELPWRERGRCCRERDKPAIWRPEY